jgi:hypothetical protein
MPRSGVFLEAAISFYSKLAFNAIGEMRAMQEDLRTGNFQVDKAIGRALSLWLEAGEGWVSALLVTASEPLPTAFLRVRPSSRTDAQFVRALLPDDPALDFTGLFQIGGNDRFPAGVLTIKRSSMGDGLEVKLKGLKDDRPSPGFYQGLVHIKGKPVALIMVEVEGDAPARGVREAPDEVHVRP